MTASNSYKLSIDSVLNINIKHVIANIMKEDYSK